MKAHCLFFAKQYPIILQKWYDLQEFLYTETRGSDILLLDALQDKIFKGIVYILECFPPDIALSQSYNQFSRVFRYVARHVGQVIDCRPAPAAFYRPFQTGISFAEDCTDNSKPAAWDNAFICEFNGNIFLMATSGTKYFF
jgi:hypothetical protein